MVRKSYGKMKRSRKKLKLEKKLTVNKFLQEFKIGDKVNINISTGKNVPTPRFHGKTGTVANRRGKSYEVRIRIGGSVKSIFIKPEHLKLIKS